jgi:hypothetical protein
MDELELRREEIEAEITDIRGTAGYRDNAALRLLLKTALLNREINDLKIKINEIKIELLQTTNADERARKQAMIERKEAEIERKELLILNLRPAPAGPSCEQLISLSFALLIFLSFFFMISRFQRDS